MKRKVEKMLACLSVGLIAAMNFLPMRVQAAYQIRPGYNALKSTPAPTFFYYIRAMETEDGPMGLSMKADYIYSGDSAEPNNIDVHMIKNSEWGAVALLSVSGYGAGSQRDAGTTGATLTWSNGNNTGVYGLGNDNWEYTMTLVSDDGSTINTSNANASLLKTSGIDSRYYDLYYPGTSNTDYSTYDTKNANKKGHAITEIRSILQNGTSGKYDYVVTAAGPFFLRGHFTVGGVFASGNSFGDSYGSGTSRAVVVCGSGF